MQERIFFALVVGIVLSSLVPLALAAQCVLEGGSDHLPPGCDREYLQMLADQNKQNLLSSRDPLIYRSGFQEKKRDPNQWAAVGFNRRVKAFVGAFHSIARENYHGGESGVESYIRGNLFTATAFLRDLDDKLDLLPGDAGNLMKEKRFEGDTLNRYIDRTVHTERQLRNEIVASQHLLDRDLPETSVYVYSYSTPCYFGCRPDVFMDSDRSLARAVRAKTNKPLKLFLAFHAQYRGNDDRQVWTGFQDYMQFPRENIQYRWTVIPLEGSFQTLLTQRLMTLSQFCLTCELKPEAGLYLTEEPNLSARARAIRYLIDTVLYYFEKVLQSDDMIYFRNIEDWLAAIKIITGEPTLNAIHTKIFTVALRKEPNDDTKFFFSPQIVRFQKLNPAAEDQEKIIYGRGLPIGPPSAKKNFFVDLSQNPFAADKWLIQCSGGYTGNLCEKHPANSLDTLLLIRKYVGYFNDLGAVGWTEVSSQTKIPQSNGIIIATSNKYYIPRPGGPRYLEVLNIGGGNLPNTFKEVAFLTAKDFSKPSYVQTQKIFFYAMPDAKFLQEIKSYVALFKATFCTLNKLPEEGGTVDRTLCQAPTNLVFVNNFWDKIRAKKSTMAQLLLTNDATNSCLFPQV